MIRIGEMVNKATQGNIDFAFQKFLTRNLFFYSEMKVFLVDY